jgi:hypothetical protein
MVKIPRTLHVADSRMPDGIIDKDAVKLSDLFDKFVIIEEKVDGTDVALSFDDNANITIQTRAKVATAKQFTRLYAFANENINQIWDIISDRYIMFGAWMYAKHTVFYDSLDHYFLEYDIYDKSNDEWLSTYKRQELIGDNKNIIRSVPILKIGKIHHKEDLKSYITKSVYKSEKWKYELEYFCNKYHYNFLNIMKETDDSDLSEGIYIKTEDKDKVVGRYKYIRHQFLNTILKSGSHYMDRPTIPNIIK